MNKNLLLPLLATLLYSGCTPTSPNIIPMYNTTAPQPEPIDSSPVKHTPLADFSYYKLQTVQGSTLTVGESHTGFLFPKFKGKIILMQILGQDCPHCLTEIPIINSIQAKYSQNLQVVALQVQENMGVDIAKSFIQQHNISYPFFDKNAARNLMYGLKTNYEWNGVLPFILLIKDGVTQEVFRGEKSQQKIEKAIQELL